MKKYTFFFFVLVFMIMGFAGIKANHALARKNDCFYILYEGDSGECREFTICFDRRGIYFMSDVEGGIDCDDVGTTGIREQNQISSSAVSNELSVPIAIGSTGNNVKIFQQALAAAGFYAGKIDGKYGSITNAAVGEFLKRGAAVNLPDGCQSILGYSVTTGAKCDPLPSVSGTTAYPTNGAKDGNTDIFVNKNVLGAESFFFTKLLKIGSAGDEVIELQKSLESDGYYTGIVDGKFGAKTESAVIKLQTDKKLKIDGVVGPQVRAILNQ